MTAETNSEVRSYAERIAKLEAQKDEIASDISDLKQEAKTKGYDGSLIAKVAKLINMEADKRRKSLDQLDLLDTYIVQAGLK